MEWMISLNLFLKFKYTKINQENIRNKVQNIFVERLFFALNFNKRTLLRPPPFQIETAGVSCYF